MKNIQKPQKQNNVKENLSPAKLSKMLSWKKPLMENNAHNIIL